MDLKKLKKKKNSKIKVPSVKIVPVDNEHVPVNENGINYVFANIESGIQSGRSRLLSHRNSINIDCGFTADVPEGFELVLDLLPELKERGIEVFKSTFRGKGSVSLSVRNLGREIVNINHCQKIALIKIVPVYELTFKVKNG